jgi:Unpaired protein
MFFFFIFNFQGIHRNWHLHMQVYVASFGLLHKIQLEEDTRTNNNTMSTELRSIFQSAKSLLCEIEDFINSTSSKKIGDENWMTRREMREALKSLNLTTDALYLNRVFVKGRFQVYIQKLYKRIAHQADNDYQEKRIDHPKEKLLKRLKNRNRKTTRRPRKMVNRKKNQNNLDAVSTKKVHIVRTTRVPGQKRKNDTRRRNRSTTEASVNV